MLVKKTSTITTAAASTTRMASLSVAAKQPQVPHCQKRHARGAFIVLEGVDRCGKTTQSKLLLQRLLAAGLAAQAMRFPNRSTATGRIINEYLTTSSDENDNKKPLDDCAIHLLFSANRWEASSDILETLANGTTIVCDRYAHSGVAFTSSKNTATDNDNNNQLSLEWCRAPDRGLPAPDCVIYLQLSADQAEERGGYGGERYEKRDMQERVRERFMELYQLDMDEVQKQQQQLGDGGDDEKSNNNINNNQYDDNNMVVIPSWTFVDAAQSVEQVEQDIWMAVQETIRQVREQKKPKPVGKMFAPGTLQLPTTISTTTPSVVKDDNDHDDWELLATTNNNVSDEENHEPPPSTTTSTGDDVVTKVD